MKRPYRCARSIPISILQDPSKMLETWALHMFSRVQNRDLKRPESRIKMTVLDCHSPRDNQGKVQQWANQQGTWSATFLKYKGLKMTAESWIISTWQHALEVPRVGTSKTAVRCTITKLAAFRRCADTNWMIMASTCVSFLRPCMVVSR